MGFATHLGPWLLGTIKNTTGSTAGTNIRNIGAVTAVQSNTMLFSDTSAKNLFVLPAGAQILSLIVDATVAFNAATNNTVTLKIGSTTLATVVGTALPIAVGRYALGVLLTDVVFLLTAGSVGTLNNIGTTDAWVTGTFLGTGSAATTGTATVSCLYTMRGSDGAQSPASA